MSDDVALGLDGDGPSTDISALGVGCAEGVVIKFLSDGASADVTTPATFTAVVRRGTNALLPRVWIEGVR